MSVDKIITRLQKKKPLTILFTEDFRDLGTPTTVKVALHRAEKKGLIKRLGKGIYTKPKYSDFLKMEVLPSATDVAQAIARRDKCTIIPTGVYAQYALGMSTQVPLNVVYLTDGSPRMIKLSTGTIRFKRTSPRNLSYKGKISSLAVQALKEITAARVNEEDKMIVISKLKDEEYHTLKQDIAIAPQWIAEIMAQALPQ
jgi:hypothetical protein